MGGGGAGCGRRSLGDQRTGIGGVDGISHNGAYFNSDILLSKETHTAGRRTSMKLAGLRETGLPARNEGVGQTFELRSQPIPAKSAVQSDAKGQS